jgi:hypothetical protein
MGQSSLQLKTSIINKAHDTLRLEEVKVQNKKKVWFQMEYVVNSYYFASRHLKETHIKKVFVELKRRKQIENLTVEMKKTSLPSIFYTL